MKKQISYDEQVWKYDKNGKRDGYNIVHYTLIANNEEEFNSHMQAVNEPNRGISNIEVKDAEPSIEELQEKLSFDDYKIIKSIEYFLSEIDLPSDINLPYDIKELHKEREDVRDQIRMMEDKRAIE